MDQEENLKGSNFHMVMGQFVKEVTETSTDDNADVTLKIMNGKKTIYQSQPLKGKGQLHYIREGGK